MYSKTSVLRLKKVLTRLMCTREALFSNLGFNANYPDFLFLFFFDSINQNSDVVLESEPRLSFYTFFYKLAS